MIVDNASRDDSAELIRRDFADCDLIFNDSNVGFGRANNQALELARGRYVLLLNTDAFVAADSIERTVRFLDLNPTCGLLGVRLAGRDGVLEDREFKRTSAWPWAHAAPTWPARPRRWCS